MRLSARAFALAAGLAAFGLAAIHLAPGASGQTGDGWVTLLDSKTMGEWSQVGETNWRLEDGASQLPTSAPARIPPTSSARPPTRTSKSTPNSGRATMPTAASSCRCQDPTKITDKSCYEVNIFRPAPGPDATAPAASCILPR